MEVPGREETPLYDSEMRPMTLYFNYNLKLLFSTHRLYVFGYFLKMLQESDT